MISNTDPILDYQPMHPSARTEEFALWLVSYITHENDGVKLQDYIVFRDMLDEYKNNIFISVDGSIHIKNLEAFKNQFRSTDSAISSNKFTKEQNEAIDAFTLALGFPSDINLRKAAKEAFLNVNLSEEQWHTWEETLTQLTNNQHYINKNERHITNLEFIDKISLNSSGMEYITAPILLITEKQSIKNPDRIIKSGRIYQNDTSLPEQPAHSKQVNLPTLGKAIAEFRSNLAKDSEHLNKSVGKYEIDTTNTINEPSSQTNLIIHSGTGSSSAPLLAGVFAGATLGVLTAKFVEGCTNSRSDYTFTAEGAGYIAGMMIAGTVLGYFYRLVMNTDAKNASNTTPVIFGGNKENIAINNNDTQNPTLSGKPN